MYTIGDFLIQIQNAYMAHKKQMEYPTSKVVLSIGKILEKEGYLGKIKTEIEKGKTRGKLVIELLYNDRVPVVSSIKLVSKPSVHHYASRNKLYKIGRNYGISIISTSKGMMTGRDARAAGLGGEVICKIQ